jgi:hypothetical protein
LPADARPGKWSTVHQLADALIAWPDAMLDLVDAGLHLKWNRPEDLQTLNELLILGGSVWQVDPNGRQLIRRVDLTAAAPYEKATTPNDVAAEELAEAWRRAYGRNPDASDAWDHAIKAVEATLIPIVSPNQNKPTLGPRHESPCQPKPSVEAHASRSQR